jgi:hypothetical protein
MQQLVKYHLDGVAPLMMHNGQLADPLNLFSKAIKQITAKRKKTDADHEEVGRLEWHGSLYLKDGKPCVPFNCIRATLHNAAKTLRLGTKVKAGLFVTDNAVLVYDGPTDLDALWADERFRDRRNMCIGGSTVMRTRPKFDLWSLDITVAFNDELLNASEVDQFVTLGGSVIGLLEDRPTHGRYKAHRL